MILDLEQTKMHTVKLLPGIHKTSGVTQHMLFDNDGIKLSVKVNTRPVIMSNPVSWRGTWVLLIEVK